MKYFKAVQERHDYFTGNTTVYGELITPRERHSKFRYIGDEAFVPVEVSRKKTVWLFGCRYPTLDIKETDI